MDRLVARDAQNLRLARSGYGFPRGLVSVRNIGQSPDMMNMAGEVGSAARFALRGVLPVDPICSRAGEDLRPRLDVHLVRVYPVTVQIGHFPDFD
jgi:hypothetical protein